MQLKHHIIIALVYFAIGGAILYFVGTSVNKSFTKNQLSANVYEATKFYKASTSATTAVTSNTLLVGSSSADYPRAYTIICNDSAQKVYLGLDNGKAMTAGVGIPLNANGGCYEINDQNLYTGAIRASSTNETSSNITVQDYTL